jgi:hypothetical protein
MPTCLCGRNYCSEWGPEHTQKYDPRLDWDDSSSDEESSTEEMLELTANLNVAVQVQWKSGEEGPKPGFKGPKNAFGNSTKGIEGPGGDVLLIRKMGGQYKDEATRTTRPVRHITDAQKLLKYQVDMGARITHAGPRNHGQQVDTKSVFDKYINLYYNHPTKAGENEPATADMTSPLAGRALIWVCVFDESAQAVKFYTHVCKQDRFHHSSFVASKGVLGAGEWVIEQGALKLVSGISGHYKPDLSLFHQSVMKMANSWNQHTKVCMWDGQENEWAERPVVEFKGNPSGGGRYKVARE